MTSLRTSNNGTVDITISQLKFAHNNIKEAPRTSLSIISWGALGTSIQSNMPSPNDITRAFDKNITGVFSSNNITIKGLIITLNEDIYSQLHHINTEDILYGCYRDHWEHLTMTSQTRLWDISQWHHKDTWNISQTPQKHWWHLALTSQTMETSLNDITKTLGISNRQNHRHTGDILQWHHRTLGGSFNDIIDTMETLLINITETMKTSHNDITEHWAHLIVTL